MGSELPRGPRSGMEIDTAALRQARLDAGLSLAQVAGSEVSRQAVHLIETGKVRPTKRTLRIIAERLGVPDWTLLAARGGVTDEGAIAELEMLCQRQEYARAASEAERLIVLGGSDELIAHCHYYAGLARHLQVRTVPALAHLREARTRFEALGDSWWAAESMDWEAMALHMLEDAGALRLGRMALRLYRALEPRRPETEARMLEHLGTICLGRRDFEAARRHYTAALELNGGVRELARLARIYHGLGMCHHGLHDRGRAAELLLKAMTLYEAEQRLGPGPIPMGLPMVEADLGVVAMAQGDLRRAEESLRAALGHYEAACIGRLRSRTLLSFAELRQREGRPDEAIALTIEAIDCASSHEEMLTVASGYRRLGELYAARGDHQLADSAFQRALGMLQDANMKERVAEVTVAYERVLADRRQAGRRARTASA